jgi:tol-pal system protein YbgF
VDKKSYKIILFSGCLACLFLAGCASKTELQNLQSGMRSQNNELRKENKELKTKLQGLEDKLKQVKKDIQETSSPVRSKQAEIWAEVESLRVQQATLMGQVDSLEREINLLKSGDKNASRSEYASNLADLVQKHEKYWQMAKSQLDLDLKEKQDKKSPPEKKPEPAEDKKKYSFDSPEEMYKQALKSFYDRKYDKAQELWQGFAREYPDHSLVPNAWFWQGEAYYQMQDYAHAVLGYQKVIADYSQSNKIKPSMLKQGISFYKMGKEKAGRLILQELIKKYPDSTEARRAKGFLTKKD